MYIYIVSDIRRLVEALGYPAAVAEALEEGAAEVEGEAYATVLATWGEAIATAAPAAVAQACSSDANNR